jgi:phosphoribosylformimino-5-aminoimidazole carboxamide ribotide isomerase
MLIIPAIDIKNGKYVRLTQGDFNREIVYGDNPAEVAKSWESQGAKMIHLVDLDGAKDGKLSNIQAIEGVLEAVNIPLQIGGGIRSRESVSKLLDLGISKVIIGTMIFENEELLKDLISKYSSQIIISLDAKNGILMKSGWMESTEKNLIETAKYLEKIGVKRFIFTDVIKDGTLTSPNYEAIKNLLANINIPLIIAGGISNVSDIQKLKDLGVEGVIIGKALYEGKIKLEEAANVS